MAEQTGTEGRRLYHVFLTARVDDHYYVEAGSDEEAEAKAKAMFDNDHENNDRLEVTDLFPCDDLGNPLGDGIWLSLV